MAFGDRLRKLREQKGITQKELGKVINTSDRVIGYYEANNRFPKDEFILKALADFFDVSVDFLVGRNSSNTSKSEFIEESEAVYNFNFEGLPPEAIKKIQEYIELIRLKYDSGNK